MLKSVKAVYIVGLLSPIISGTGAWAQPCEPYNTRISQQFAGPVAAAQASGDSCKMTKVLIQELQATRKIIPKCFIGQERIALIAEIDRQIATDKVSFSDHCN